MLYPLKFKPNYKDYIWGGRALESLGKALPDGIVAESWELSCHPAGLSVISNGHLAGRALKDMCIENKDMFLGKAFSTSRFPILVKLIDANDDLSVQVHPDDDYAYNHENGDYGKDEMWYVVKAEPDSKIVCGLKPYVTKEMFMEAIEKDTVMDCLKEINVKAGDTIHITPGTLHSLGKGIIIAEVQTSSNLTYRVYDFARVDSSGKGRELHIKKALDVIDFGKSVSVKNFEADNEVDTFDGDCHNSSAGCGYKSSILADVPNFKVTIYKSNTEVIEHTDGLRFAAYIILEGSGNISYESGNVSFQTGETIFIPAALGKYIISGKFNALKCQ